MRREIREELKDRGFSRRDFARLAALMTAGASLPFYNESALAQDLKAIGRIPTDAVKINANENPMGPCPAAIEAITAIVRQGGRYLFEQTYAFVEAMAQAEGVPEDHVLPFPGSSDPLHRAVLAFTAPTRPLVTANPGYEAPEKAAQFIGARTIQVPLRKDYSHDPKGMVEAGPNAGVIYVCNPNNPTGTVTRREDLDYIVANKPKGCVVLIDEAYIHFTTATSPATDLVAAGKDVIVLRTFSKLYGMAGLRAGAAIARPDLLEKLRNYGGLGIMPATGMAGAVASLKDRSLVAERRKVVADIREDLCAWMQKKGYGFIPSEANMILVDGRRPGRQMARDMIAYKVAVGRAWPALPNHVRVTIGTRDEMARFKVALERVMEA
ncbi:pyridoxal phosphate-dependent aminotransferase [Aquisphaera giovannonii]|uniref:pyridoxal phosphate-dependent aminotransferase n=1 Tax=Aquisphaera giovannonii TaxID=406548 RepID=UPI001AF02345|nr:pyridoxal phosphate-dependent aminotransferase [Aquisphaera giovannonii]